jgi:HK97 family phage major capsid protein
MSDTLIARLVEQRDKQQAEAEAILKRGEDAGGLSAADDVEVQARTSDLNELNQRIADLEATKERNAECDAVFARHFGQGGKPQAIEDGAPLAPEQRMVDFVVQRGAGEHKPGELSLRKYLRGLATGEWENADAERRAMAEGTSASGGYAVPTILAAEIIDLARNKARVLQAGARIVPMTSKTLDMAKWTGDQTAAWRNEAGTITPTDATLGTVQLTAKSLASLTIASRELLEDAPNVEDELREAFAEQFALTVDLATLYGSGTAPEPRGVKNSTGITTTSLGTNGAALSYDNLVDAVGVLADANETASGVIYAPRSARGLAKLKDSNNMYLEAPEYIRGLPRYESTQVPTDLTQGTSSLASDVFVGDWGQLLLGVRTALQIQVLTEKYADTGQVGFVAHWRGDVAVARGAAFNVLTGAL